MSFTEDSDMQSCRHPYPIDPYGICSAKQAVNIKKQILQYFDWISVIPTVPYSLFLLMVSYDNCLYFPIPNSSGK